jgi:hypothetical protein
MLMLMPMLIPMLMPTTTKAAAEEEARYRLHWRAKTMTMIAAAEAGAIHCRLHSAPWLQQ